MKDKMEKFKGAAIAKNAGGVSNKKFDNKREEHLIPLGKNATQPFKKGKGK